MFNIYDPQCPICRAQKQVRVQYIGQDDPTTTACITKFHTRDDPWGYIPGPNEIIVEAFCPECGTKFMIPE